MFFSIYKISATLIIAGLTIFGISYFFYSDNVFNEIDRSLFVYATTNSSGSLQNQVENAKSNNHSSASNSSQAVLDKIQMMSPKEKQFLCGNKTQGSSYYISEFVTPIPCNHPVGLVADKDNNIWVASGWSGNILVFNPHSNTFVKTIQIPNWPQQKGPFGSMIWDMGFDKNGDLWFTDEKTNSIWKYFTKEGKFENYKLLAKGGYPLSFVFDSNNNIWFTQVFGKRLGLLDPLKVESNTTKGISEMELSKQIKFETMGPISNGFGFTDNTKNRNKSDMNETLWFSTVSFPVGGQLIKYDITEGTLTVHDLTNTHSVPISVTEDDNGTVWTNDHASSLFIMFDPKTGYSKQYATSFPSTANTTTLPYYNQYRDGKIWFNEHYGNAIASYDIKNKTLVEYHIPSRNPLWANSSNPLKFAFDNDGSVWFTEWTENKLGVIPKEKINQLPISLSTSKDAVTIDSKNGKGDTVDVFIDKNNLNATGDSNNNNTILAGEEFNKPANVTMFVTSSVSKNGSLLNLTSSFSKDRFSTTDLPITAAAPYQPYKTTLEINPTKDIVPGNYTLTISARYNDDITVSKIIDLDIQ
jgi:virginiamycin B lyase